MAPSSRSRSKTAASSSASNMVDVPISAQLSDTGSSSAPRDPKPKSSGPAISEYMEFLEENVDYYTDVGWANPTLTKKEMYKDLKKWTMDHSREDPDLYPAILDRMFSLVQLVITHGRKHGVYKAIQLVTAMETHDGALLPDDYDEKAAAILKPPIEIIILSDDEEDDPRAHICLNTYLDVISSLSSK